MRLAIATVTSAALLGAACGGGSAVSQMRFHNQDPVWVVDDRRPIGAKPEENPEYRFLSKFDRSFLRRVTRAMELPERQRAKNVNALDEVPDSTWFTNRIGRYDLTPEDVARGPNRQSRMAPGALMIESTKVGGTAAGYIVKDEAGDRWLLKFDEREPVTETATDVVVQRLLWALGYHVPENHVEYITRDRLVIGDDAMFEGTYGDPRPLTATDVDRTLSEVHHAADGSIRVLASKFLPGEPLGGFSHTGTRDDDPNDKVPHQHRREIRGLYAVFSWLKHTDVKDGNTLDMLVEDASRPGNYFVMHYLVDFGKALGAGAKLSRHPGDGHVHDVDYWHFFASAASLGLWKRPWEGTHNPGIVGVGLFDVEHYDPDEFRTRTPYFPFYETDRYDAFWATKLVMRLTPEHIRAAVRQGEFPDARAVDYLTEVLVARQRKLGRYWFLRVNPLDDFELRDRALCFDDLLVTYGLASEIVDDTRYLAAVYDRDGKRLADLGGRPATPSGEVCLPDLPVASTNDGYTIVKLKTTHPKDDAYKPIEVHLARSEAGAFRIIGLNRR